MTGRWPANVILSPGIAEVLDQQSGNVGQTGSKGGTRTSSGFMGKFTPVNSPTNREGAEKRDAPGGASRFFLNADYEPWELDWILANGLRPCGDQQ